MSDGDELRRRVERGLRFTNLMATTTQQNLIDVAAQVAALVQALADKGLIDTDALAQRHAELVDASLHMADDATAVRVELMPPVDKYEVTGPEDLDCISLLHLCKGRCCKLSFALSTQDLDEGVIKWDYGRPYLIRQDPATGACCHQGETPEGIRGPCTAYEHRPAACRRYDCRDDKRIWADFANRIPAPEG